jgi:hypothetical protein
LDVLLNFIHHSLRHFPQKKALNKQNVLFSKLEATPRKLALKTLTCRYNTYFCPVLQ